ncbi:hypothetical protein SOPP22_11250 [Shewanella sp. OPT22]|nr:hypothetical protein SOPP22_11250 [Shewanella sp. OPT22]
MVKRLILLTISLFGFIHSAVALTTIEASVDRNPVVQGEYFVLTVTGDDDLAGNAINTSILDKDFVIGRTSVNRSTQIINFDTQKKTSWQILLAAKNKGIATIPAFNINGVKSNPIALQVVTDNNAKQKSKDVFIKTTLKHKEAYVGQLLTYNVKLYLAVDLQRGVLNAPDVANAQVKQIGDDKDKTEVVNGRRFRVIERTYGVIADKQGTVDIGEVSFEGDVLSNARQGLGMFSFNESRPVRVTSPSQKITILPKPKSYHGNWLVSDLVVLKENWTKHDKDYELGAPITRTITLYASNTDETSLPEIESVLPSNMKSYPEKPKRKTYTRNGNIVGELVQTEAIVPTKAGTFTFPEVKIPWWNPIRKKQEYATLPAKTIVVKGSATAANVNPIVPSAQAQSSTEYSAGYWPWLTALFALLWLVSSFMWLRKPKVVQIAGDDESDIGLNAAPNLKETEKEIRTNFEQNRYGKVLSLLQKYYAAKLGRPVNLHQLTLLAPELSDLIRKLQATQYGKNNVQIDISLLNQALKIHVNLKDKAKKDGFVDLNP